MQRALRLTILIALMTASAAAAQTKPAGTPPAPTSRVFVSINGAFQATSNDFSDDFTFRENAEDGRVETDYTVDSGPAFDVSGGAAIWRNLGAGIGMTLFSRSTPAAVSATVPHPFFFNQPRSIAGDATGLEREERALHVQARVTFPVNPRIQVTVFGGPSFFTVKQGLVDAVEFTESYPYDEATFDQAVTSTVEASKTGFNVGGDFGYFFSQQFGVGVLVQYAGATVELPSATSGAVEVEAGGLQVGGGLRLRF